MKLWELEPEREYTTKTCLDSHSGEWFVAFYENRPLKEVMGFDFLEVKRKEKIKLYNYLLRFNGNEDQESYAMETGYVSFKLDVKMKYNKWIPVRENFNILVSFDIVKIEEKEMEL